MSDDMPVTTSLPRLKLAPAARAAIDYHARSTDQASQREISPQRLVHYRYNWYLDAWCHTREALRSFSVDAIRRLEVIDARAIDVPEEKLDAVLGSGYGIFGGEEVKWATLRFTPKLARWLATERWHEKQKTRLLEDGSFELTVPYSNDTELLMDILKYGAECEVVGPEELRGKLVSAISDALGRYS
jgi:predicted DNA-binding transcriptional regulator YafY